VSFDDPQLRRGSEFHPFSITSAPEEGELRLLVKALGDFTSALQRLQPGTHARVEGPYGGLSYTRVPNARQIWIAGGIGVTPFLSMARSLAPTNYEIDFYYCTERGSEAYFEAELFDISEANRRLRVIPIRRDTLGFVTAADVAGASRDLPSKDILICGPPVMIRGLHAQFRQLGVPARQLHTEEFSFA
jgi:predicted ferric reductase